LLVDVPLFQNYLLVSDASRFVIAFGCNDYGGSTLDPMLIRWSDQENIIEWTPDATNQAGSIRLSHGSQIVTAIQTRQEIVVFTDQAVSSLQYVGAPYYWKTQLLGDNISMMGPNAAVLASGVVYWMGQSQFFNMTPNGVQPIFCPVWDVIFQELDTANVSKIRVAPNSRFGEISWFIPTTSSGGEVGMYAKLNVVTNQWDYGTLTRTAWINQSVLGPPIGGSSNGLVYQHETSNDADGSAMNSSFQTGYFVLGDGDVMTYIDQFWPDAKWGFFGGTPSATLQITFYVVNYPGDTPTAYGPFSVTQATEYITPRFRGRLVSIKVESTDVGSFWRLGAMRYRYQPDGKF
jgi:hypothetical protein